MGTCFGRCLIGRKRCSAPDEDDKNLVENDDGGNSSNNGFVFRILKMKPKKHSKFLDKFLSQRNDSNYSRLNKDKQKPRQTSDIQLQCLDAHSLLITSRDRIAGYRPDLYTGLTSSPGSSSLDLEWEHEYGPNHSWLCLPEEITINELSSGDDANNDDGDDVDDDDDDDESSSHNSSDSTSVNEQNNASVSNASANFIPIKHGRRFKIRNSQHQHHHHHHHHQQQQQQQRKAATATSSSINSLSHISTPDSMEWDVGQEQQLKSEDDSLDQETKDLLNEIEQLKNRVLSETGTNFDQQEFHECES